MPPDYAGVSFYADLSAKTMSRRRDFINITKCLRNNKVPYRWVFPKKILAQQISDENG
ncbi:Hypothetical predicted protein [Pelobates cultripes]|uniref:Uncharacterized protein n=1 Tax=Pelobates cultripes TaxID=61616 RepID=A0AAD1SG66_PELCU|nr:Hypothetical predicted protein [Pelobates cultripes]